MAASSKKLKVLFVYPNVMLQNTIPISLSILSACLKQAGFDRIRLFDTTLYRTQETSGDEIRARYLQFKKWDFSERGVTLKEADVLDDFEACVREFDPDLIALTVVENTHDLAFSLLDRVRHLGKRTIVGGVLATFTPEEILAHETVDMICVGEGERALVELCERLEEGRDYSDIHNLWVKTPRGVVRNPVRPLVELDALPDLDFSLFEEQRFYRPNRGRIFKTFPVETSRGCPYRCTFCCASSWAEMFQNRFYRERELDMVMEEVARQKQDFSMEFAYFSAETFLAMSDRRFEQFLDMYEAIDLPFWFQTRPETIDEERLTRLGKFDFRLSMGIESGSEPFRRDVLNRRVTNRQVVDASATLNRLGITYGVNNIIGFPDETRQDIFETIELNRRCQVKDVNVFIFVPYKGTKLHQLCVDKGYIPADHIARNEHTFNSSLAMPSISAQELYGLFRTFPMYVKMPKRYWPDIERAEAFDEEGDTVYEQLAEVYRQEYQ